VSPFTPRLRGTISRRAGRINALQRQNDILFAYMDALPETPHADVRDICTGHFHAVEGYFAHRSHGTRDWLMIHTLSGYGRFGFHDGAVTASAGDIALLPPGVLHHYGVHPQKRKWELLWAHFHPRPQWLDLLNWPIIVNADGASTGIMRLQLSPPLSARLARRFSDVHRLANAPQRNRVGLAMNALEEVLLWCDEWNPARSTLIDPRIQAAIELMCGTLDRPLRVEESAEVAGLSTSRFTHLFRAVTGSTPQRYHEQRRLDRASRLLENTSIPIKRIARELGFDNQFYFSRRFALHAGCSPRDYRQGRRGPGR